MVYYAIVCDGFIKGLGECLLSAIDDALVTAKFKADNINDYEIRKIDDITFEIWGPALFNRKMRYYTFKTLSEAEQYIEDLRKSLSLVTI